MIGLSLSFCIKAHLQDGIPLPDRIIAGTRCETLEQFEQVLDSYTRVYWRKFPEEARAIALGYFETGRLEQPRISGEDHPGPNRGVFAVGDFEWLIEDVNYEAFKKECEHVQTMARDH